ncbi:MAG: AraC family transcriptional regulator [Syntrophomonas sp.]
MNSNISLLSVTKIAPFFNIYELHGIPKETLLKSAGINPCLFDSPDNKITSYQVHKLLLKLVSLTNNENIGLELGKSLSKGFSNILGYILMNCRTLGDAAEKYCLYEKLVDTAGITTVKIDGSLATMSVTIIDNILVDNRQYSDYKISGLLSYIKVLTGNNMGLHCAHFRHQQPPDLSAYQRIFQSPVYFARQNNALVFDKKLLQLPIVEPNFNLLDLFEKTAQEALKSEYDHETFTSRVARIILEEMNREIPPIEAVARRLAVSVRSLQSYLHKEHTSFSEIANEIRKGIALQCLRDKNISINEIAYIVGFSEASAFHRAFKKWTQLTPNEYRLISHHN